MAANNPAAELARDNSRAVQQIMRSDEYRMMFPDAVPTSVATIDIDTVIGVNTGILAAAAGGGDDGAAVDD